MANEKPPSSDEPVFMHTDPDLAMAIDVKALAKQPDIKAGDRVIFRGRSFEVAPIEFDGLIFEDGLGSSTPATLLGFTCDGMTILAGLNGKSLMGLHPSYSGPMSDAVKTMARDYVPGFGVDYSGYSGMRMRNRFKGN